LILEFSDQQFLCPVFPYNFYALTERLALYSSKRELSLRVNTHCLMQTDVRKTKLKKVSSA